ncbi:MAG: DUF3843 family protein [Rhodopirellula sp.]|nr:DUF3843 family protein [Rhodopirellula sp.]
MADYSAHRPQGFRGHVDVYLAQVARQLHRSLRDLQRDFVHDTLRLGNDVLSELAGVLVDFGEDIHNGTGIWEAYERYNVEFFGTALPLTSADSSGDTATGFCPDRLRHLLWILYPALLDGLTLSPTHQDLRRVADAASEILSDAFADVPKDSGVKAFLASSNEHGWDVKRKLVWLGTHSFMFRTMFARYIENQSQGKADIAHTDDFVCQECTCWSGLGVIDILAGLLDICDEDRRDLRTWCERHTAFYKIVSADAAALQAVNVINDQPYRIRIDMKRHPFRRKQIVFGSVVPWRGEWYWSGEQRLVGNASGMDMGDLKRTMKRQSSGIVCRYSKEYETLVRQRMSEMHRKTLEFHGGKDLVVYPDGLAMAADWQRELRWHWEQKPREEVEAAVRKHGLKKGRPEVNLPKDLLDEKDGLGVFLNPDEGKEIMTHFTTLLGGLRKKGGGLTEDEEAAIRGFVESPTISPRFVRRVLEEYGDQWVNAAFVLKGDLPGYWLDYLLRSRKGHYFRKRYPTLSVV